VESSQFQNAAALGAVGGPEGVRDDRQLARISSVWLEVLEVKVRSAALASSVSSTDDSLMVTMPEEGTSATALLNDRQVPPARCASKAVSNWSSNSLGRQSNSRPDAVDHQERRLVKGSDHSDEAGTIARIELSWSEAVGSHHAINGERATKSHLLPQLRADGLGQRAHGFTMLGGRVEV
jgi:hypothetical protein